MHPTIIRGQHTTRAVPRPRPLGVRRTMRVTRAGKRVPSRKRSNNMVKNRCPLMPVPEKDIRRKAQAKRMRRKTRTAMKMAIAPKTRIVDAKFSKGFKYKVFFVVMHARSKPENSFQRSETISEFVRDQFSGRFKLGWVRLEQWGNRQHYKKVQGDVRRTSIAECCYLDDENDLFTLMLCHSDWVVKIFHFE